MKLVPVVEVGINMHFNIHTKKLLTYYVDVPKLHSCVITPPVCDYREVITERFALMSGF